MLATDLVYVPVTRDIRWRIVQSSRKIPQRPANATCPHSHSHFQPASSQHCHSPKTSHSFYIAKMGRRPFGTDTERDWLDELQPEFGTSRSNSKSTPFMTSMYQRYFDHFYPEVKVPDGADEKEVFFTTLQPDAQGNPVTVSVWKRKDVSFLFLAANRSTHH